MAKKTTLKEIGDMLSHVVEHMATNGIGDFFAGAGHFSNELCVGATCVTPTQFQAMVAAAGAATAASGGTAGAPGGQPAPGELNASTTSSTTSATLTVNGNDPAQWQEGTPWQDNLGALFTNAGQSTTIYSTATVDVIVAGTTILDYWAVVPSTQAVLHTTRQVVVQSAANDNAPIAPTDASSTPPAANDIRYVVTSLEGSAQQLYEEVYCKRGQMVG